MIRRTSLVLVLVVASLVPLCSCQTHAHAMTRENPYVRVCWVQRNAQTPTDGHTYCGTWRTYLRARARGSVVAGTLLAPSDVRVCWAEDNASQPSGYEVIEGNRIPPEYRAREIPCDARLYEDGSWLTPHGTHGCLPDGLCRD